MLLQKIGPYIKAQSFEEAQKIAQQKHAEIKKSKENRLYRYKEKMETMFIGAYDMLKNRDNNNDNIEEKEV